MVGTQKGAPFNSAYSPIGAYFIQVIKVRSDASVEQECTVPPAGHDLDGCANFLWSVFSGEPRHAKRHMQCEKYLPQSSPVGSHTHHGSFQFDDHKLKKTGTYTIRIRSLINNCFGWTSTYCKPYAGPFDLKARIRSTANTGPPDYSGGSSSSVAVSPYIRKHFVPIGIDRVIKNSCESDSAASNTNVTEVCYSTEARNHTCANSYSTYTDRNLTPYESHVTDLAVNVTAGEVFCITASQHSLRVLQLLDPSGKQLAAGEPSYKGVEEFEDGIGLFGFKAPYTGEMIARFMSTSLDDTTVRIELCPDKHVDAGNLDSTLDCSSYRELLEWDKCFTTSDPTIIINASGDNVTFASGSSEKIAIGKVGIDLDTQTGSFYFEVELGGTEPQFRFDTTSNVELEYAIGFATRALRTDGWLGIDDQTFVWRSGRKYNDAGSSAYGEDLHPGDIVSVAFDAFQKRVFMAKNGYWQSPSGCNFDMAGMKYNNYPPALCIKQYGFDCRKPPPTNGYMWGYNTTTYRYEYIQDPEAHLDKSGYGCCPMNMTYLETPNPNNYNKLPPR